MAPGKAASIETDNVQYQLGVGVDDTNSEGRNAISGIPDFLYDMRRVERAVRATSGAG
jgi:hypothetical protein